MELEDRPKPPRRSDTLARHALESSIEQAELCLPENFKDIVVDTLRQNTRGAVHPAQIAKAVFGSDKVDNVRYAAMIRALDAMRNPRLIRSKRGNYSIEGFLELSAADELERRIRETLRPGY
ncbi:TPA: hypothetical protein DIV49_01975 [Candidatus Saccharibacteria bacterium]|nr:hypothetical protein [Candidatus Saccharibacteria bacterium]HRJ90711.1 hypothetical protein [Candidatus Saccharibacteria bacterium]